MTYNNYYGDRYTGIFANKHTCYYTALLENVLLLTRFTVETLNLYSKKDLNPLAFKTPMLAMYSHTRTN